MIDKKSLMLGNLVVLAHESNAPIATIKELRDKFALVDDNGEVKWINYDLLLPIDLNEHWLDRLGFEYGVNGEGEDKVEYWDKRAPLHQHSFGCFTFTITKWFEGNFTFSHYQIRRDCKYLHDLQNIWYFNTGQELTIKEPINEK